jgi:hypothetical protein
LDGIQHLLERADEVCRESERLRADVERAMRRRDFWPDRRQAPRRHPSAVGRDDYLPDGSGGTY